MCTGPHRWVAVVATEKEADLAEAEVEETEVEMVVLWDASSDHHRSYHFQDEYHLEVKASTHHPDA